MTLLISFLLTKACTIENQYLNMVKDDVLYYLALQSVEGIGPVNARKLIEHCGGARQVLEENQKKFENIKGIGPHVLKQLKTPGIFKKAEKELQYIEKHKITLPILLDTYKRTFKSYGVIHIPTFYLLDKNANIVLKKTGYIENLDKVLETKIIKLLKK